MGPATFATGVPTKGDINTYRKAKLKILKRDFYIKLTPEELAHANSLKTEIEIDNFFISAIKRQQWI